MCPSVSFFFFFGVQLLRRVRGAVWWHHPAAATSWCQVCKTLVHQSASRRLQTSDSCRLLCSFNADISLLSSGIPTCGRLNARCVFTHTHVVLSRKHTQTHISWRVLSPQIGEERATAIALMRKFIAYQFTDTVRSCSVFYQQVRILSFVISH